MNLTKTSVERIPTPEKTAFHWDDKLPGFGVRVTPTGVKSFIIQKRINGKDKRITLGRFGVLTVEQGRKQAQKKIGQIATGGDPVADKQRHKLETVTLAQAFDAYIKRRKTLKDSTIKDMHRCLNENLDNWKNTPLLDITADRVVKQHERIGRRSHARADVTMRYLRAVFNFAMAEYLNSDGAPIIAYNPVTRLSQTRAWFKLKPRQTLIKAHQLTDWFQGVEALTSEVARDYLRFVILTGLRRTEALELTWSAVDLEAKTFTCYDTKNHKDHTLPLSDYLMAMLERRKATRDSQYVFAHDNGNPFKFPEKSVKRVVEYSGVKFTMHDLRRTFATIAESLDIPGYALKRLLNHSDGADVTAGYIVADVERLRKPMQQVTDFILRAGGVIETADIIPLLGSDAKEG